MNQLSTYLEHLSSEGRSPAYVRKQRNCLTRLLPDPQAELDRLAATATEVTLRDALNRLRCYGAWLVRSGQDNPFLDVSAGVASRVASDRATINRAEVKLLTTCPEIPAQRRALWTILASTGLRPVEASRVRPEHITRQGGEWVLLLPSACQKARRADPIGLTKAEVKLIRDHCPLVPGAVDKLYRHFRKDLAAAGVPVMQHGVARTPYNLRSYFVTELIRQGADPKTVQMLARHRDYKTTATHYARFTRAEVAKTRQQLLLNN